MKRTLLAIILLCSINAGAQFSVRFEVFFDSGSATLTDKARTTLDTVRHRMKNKRYTDFFVKGYTDSTGSSQKNMALARAREQAVVDYIADANPHQEIVMGTMYGYEKYGSGADSLNRRVSLLLGMRCGYYPCYGTKTFYGNRGTIVTGYWKSQAHDHAIGVTEGLPSQVMLAENLFAIDSLGNILDTGHITEVTGKIGDCHTYLDVTVPFKGSGNPGPEIWIPKYRADGSSYFAKSDYNVLTLERHCEFILFDAAGGAENKFRFCMIKPTLRNGKPQKTHKVIYIATHKPFDFETVSVGTRRLALSFAAKVNDTLYAFTAPVRLNARGMRFRGTNSTQPAENLEMSLRNCIYSSDSDKNQLFYVCEGCEQAPTKNPVKTRKGFFAWFRRVFGGE